MEVAGRQQIPWLVCFSFSLNTHMFCAIYRERVHSALEKHTVTEAAQQDDPTR